ncbi:POP1 ribonuclease P/MRP subunit [Glossina fuscipes fuscipes]
MVTKKMEYDTSLVGSHMPTFQYAASVLKEMIDLVKSVQHPTSNKLVFQTLPKRMRRRAMSHHPKRLPRKYRTAHIAQMSKSGRPQQVNRPSRKYRRRPRNLLADYLRRQRKHKWLETHIWHAKRFHMIERWGYRLPYGSCDKTFRACYRASAEHCLLQDISFYACIEMRGLLEDLEKGFEHLTSQHIGLRITASTFVNGRREGSVDLFKYKEYPFKALGRVNFLWRPLTQGQKQEQNLNRVLWLWMHPSSSHCIVEELIKVFELKSAKITKIPLGIEDENPKIDGSSKMSAKIQRRLKFMTKFTVRQNIPTYKNNLATIELRELSGTINRFRLTGPLAQRVLSHAFKVKDFDRLINAKKTWVGDLLGEQTFLDTYKQQQQYWEKCQKLLTSPSQLLSNMVLALCIEDPRLHRPKKRTKAISKTKSDYNEDLEELLVDMPSALSESSLWEQCIRDRVSNEMVTSHSYYGLREKQAIVPGQPCQFEDALQPIPVLLIQRPGSQRSNFVRLGYGCGWDVIAPAGYGLHIWLSCIMWGARPGGLREFETIGREMGIEQHSPDTISGKRMAAERYVELRDKYFRLPPNKRVSYRKLSILSPFRAPFSELVRDWKSDTTNVNDFYVLRDRSKLKDIVECIKRSNPVKFPSSLKSECLIQLRLSVKRRGSPNNFSLICLPIRNDFKRNLKHIYLRSNDPVFTEPLLSDPNEKERKKFRLQHKKLLKRLRARRIREKRKKQETSNTKVYIRSAGTAAICAAQFKKMCELWLPEDTSTLYTVRKQGCRDVFGYLTSVNFCLSEGTVGGIGYVTAEGLKSLLKLCQKCHLKEPMCLVRPNNSRHYRFATFKVNLDVW